MEECWKPLVLGSFDREADGVRALFARVYRNLLVFMFCCVHPILLAKVLIGGVRKMNLFSSIVLWRWQAERPALRSPPRRAVLLSYPPIVAFNPLRNLSLMIETTLAYTVLTSQLSSHINIFYATLLTLK